MQEAPKEQQRTHDPFGMSKFSIRRGSIQVQLLLLASIATTTALTVKNAAGGNTTDLTLAAAAMGLIIVMTIIIGRITLKTIQAEIWIRKMGMGDLEHRVEPTGNDEITRTLEALETLRQSSIKAMQSDRVERLSNEIQSKNNELERALADLRNSQDQVISRQKLAELGELTAGVAHEIRNPLNLIQNFARNSDDMMNELRETLSELDGAPSQEQKELIGELTGELTGNMDRIRQHGDRANRIVQDMLAMGRNSKGRYQTVNLNTLVEDHAMLAYHSARSRDPQFNMKIIKDYDKNAGEVNVVSEDIGRVILNLVGNACYATTERNNEDECHQPTMWITTLRENDSLSITVRDNGMGIPHDIIDKIFNPFFTTKPADLGTGLGLSLSNDIIREHGGNITPQSTPGDYTLITVTIPIRPPPDQR